MKCLKYCLSWLQYAVQHIEQQMTLLRQFLVSLATNQQQQQQKQVTQGASDTTLNNIKKEIVDTLRKVVEVVSRYAGKGLPEQAKLTVRSFILELPSRWAMVNQQALDEVDTPLHVTSIKLLDFSGESIRMLKSVSLVFSDTVERAELWLKRLKAVGGTTGH
ncbi:Opi1-domain-containing protein [Rhizopus microsporus var. microsporus]|nr:Opi1-domain-containing protein [Rhizopus microsporus var. microsporus]